MEQVRQNFAAALILILISAAFFTLDKLGTAITLKKVLAVPFEVVQFPLLLAKTSLVSKIEFLANLGKVESQNRQLLEKLVLLEAENVRLQELAQENQALRAQIGFFAESQKSIAAIVVGRSRFLIIQPEKIDGVKKEATIALGNNFVGKVAETGFKLVKVRLAADPASSIPALVQTPSGRVYGVLVGKYGRFQVLEKIEKSEIVPEGSLVLTSGEAGIKPGLVLGKVGKVEKIDTAPFLEIEVESFLDFSKLSTVFVISEQ